MATTSLLDLNPRDWPQHFVDQGYKKFHGKIAAKWVFERGIYDWQAMTDLPAAMRDELSSSPLLDSELVESLLASDGAHKVLLKLTDGSLVEAVCMPGSKGQTICISTQVGCGIRCQFCASGMEGLKRNLTQSEILQQIFWMRREFGDFHRIVVMGMGEVGHNLSAVLGTLDCLIDEAGGNFSGRRITVSTVAPEGAIAAIANFGKTVQLAISLHATTDELRQQLVPGIKDRTIEQLLDEAEGYFNVTGREFTIEYVLLAGVNDSIEQAQQLADLLRNSRCHINLIPYNNVDELDFHYPDGKTCEQFAQRLRDNAFSVTLRMSMGKDKQAACGQLRRRIIELDV
ncbi:MAG: 23S rRNA (adenine(2503)-C(2))-methyltransferase RlmN [Planctomycetes bacterium]|nr:23S rRNA (adenine(2503)-C(2))-methyltransferase RlmN [Planctomycetota bacterium]